jgi:hypothetical protein
MRNIWYLFLGTAILAACSTPSSTEELLEDVVPDVHSSADGVAGVDVVLFLDAHKAPPDLDIMPDFNVADIEPEALLPQCQPGEGCFLDGCGNNADCQSGWCVEHLGEAVCSQSCQDECPAGWSCQQVAGTEPDVVFICVSDYANLCKPCAINSDCGTVGKQDVCLPYGDDGSFCGGSCVDSDGNEKECPWGFVCQEVETVDGATTSQCVAEAGVCPCTDKSAQLGLSTPCSVENEFGYCAGHRVCTMEGLSDCDALVPAVEICNGVDDDCNGKADEGTCDDDIACTLDTCAPDTGCLHEPLENGECADGNPCTVADHCVAGECIGSTVICDDSNPCTDDSCNAEGGCFFTPNNEGCDDNNPCTTGDHCEATICSGFDIECGCQSDADCAPLDNGDVCDGVLYCDTASLPYQCAVLPDSEIECPAEVGIDATCLAPACDGQSGECSLVPDHEQLACNDGDACTIGETCNGGVCGSGASLNCNDGNLCTDDLCDGESGCIYVNNVASCQDGSVCTVNDICAEGSCQPGQVLACDDLNPCTDDGCDQDTGCQFEAKDGECSDLNPCTVGDHCVGGLCTAGSMLDCNDENPCTDDSCDAQKGCVHQLNQNPCDDQNACTENDHCNNGWCLGKVADCNDFNICTEDSCSADEGCLHSPNEALCNDGSLCTLGDHCKDGECQAVGDLDCDDDDICTDDICNPALGCVSVFNEAPCDDGDDCTATDLCQGGQCAGTVPVICNDDIQCTTDSCVAEEGCQFVPTDSACDDDNPCTDDVCELGKGCVHSLNQAPCEDGDPCTIGEQCSAGICEGGIVDDCDDNDVCTEDVCHEQQGCLHTPLFGDCDDGNPCTENSCDPDSGCIAVPLDGACEGGQCVNGICEAVCVPECGGKECGADGCEGTCGSCDDGFNCVNGSCVESGNNECNDGNDILWDGCTKGEISEFRVNTFTPGQQTMPSLATLANGSWVMVWDSFDQDGDQMGVFGQRFDAVGKALGEEFQINSYVAESQASSDVAALSDGGFIVAWHSTGSQDGSGYGVFGQRFDAAGGKVGNELALNSTTNSHQIDCAVTGLTDGGFVSAWRHNSDGSGYGIRGRSFDSLSAPQQGDYQINSYTYNQQYYADVAAVPGGGYVAVWQSDSQDKSGWGVYGQEINQADGKVGSEFRVNTYTPGQQRYPRIASASDGSYFVVWESDSEDGSSTGVYAQRYKADGTKNMNPFRVNTYIVSSQERPDVAAWPDGRFVVVWTSSGQDGVSGGIFGQRFNADGTPAGSEFQVNVYTEYHQHLPTVATFAEAGFVVAWTSNAQDDSVSGVFAQRYDAAGNKLYH